MITYTKRHHWTLYRVTIQDGDETRKSPESLRSQVAQRRTEIPDDFFCCKCNESKVVGQARSTMTVDRGTGHKFLKMCYSTFIQSPDYLCILTIDSPLECLRVYRYDEELGRLDILGVSETGYQRHPEQKDRMK